MSKEIALAEALLLRKHFAAKVKQLESVKHENTFQLVMQRKAISESTDDIVAKVPKLTASQVTHEYDFYAKRLREIDAIIQKANWENKVVIEDSMSIEYAAPTAPALPAVTV